MKKSPLFLTILAMILLLTWHPAAWALVVTDQRNRVVQVNKPFSRIISLYGAHTENLFSLGAQDQIIGISLNDDYPPEVKDKPRFSYHDGLEKFLAARPDLILIRPMIDNGYPDFVRQLEQHGIVVVSLQPASISDMYAYWLILGQLTGKTDAAQKLVSWFQSKVTTLSGMTRDIPHKKRVYFQAIHKSMRTFTPGAFPLFALEVAGGLNAAPDASASRNTNVAVYSRERIIEKAEQIDVILAQKGIMNPVKESDITGEPGFHVIKAVREGQVFLIDEGIVSRPVPRLYQGILTIGNLLYPDLFSHISIEKDIL